MTMIKENNNSIVTSINNIHNRNAGKIQEMTQAQ